ncbi:efflux RND transporter periplasmic adaptor subunit [Fusobacterium perfoetens]|uniref:efflux RND transporter periplasmic adaptor subunit n=1 Tax=Fusobacterium perfoetens TaxID=852 RepID=UPI000483976B|nr:efflux RND transporter periplasmic adaptor subunit [Fusobacterium perfoetens]
MKKLLCLSLLSTFIFIGCGKKEEVKEVVVKPKYVVTEEVQTRELSQTFRSDAVLEPENKVDHTTEKGGTIEKIYKKNGDYVKKGEVVMKLSDADTEAAYNSSKALFNVANNNFKKFKKLYAEELISYLEYVEYENAYSTAKANFDVAKNNYEKLFRKADIDGTVGNLFGKVGNEVEGNTTIFTVVDDNLMEAYVGFPAEWLGQIKVGGPLSVEVPAINKTLEGTILEINPIAESDTKKYKIKVGVKNPEKTIKDGMYSYVTIPVGKVSAMSVPDESIFIRDLLNYVFIVKDGVAKRVKVEVGAQDSTYTVISSDEINLGDKVVVKGIFGLEDGNKVTESVSNDIKSEETKNSKN